MNFIFKNLKFLTYLLTTTQKRLYQPFFKKIIIYGFILLFKFYPKIYLIIIIICTKNTNKK